MATPIWGITPTHFGQSVDPYSRLGTTGFQSGNMAQYLWQQEEMRRRHDELTARIEKENAAQGQMQADLYAVVADKNKFLGWNPNTQTRVPYVPYSVPASDYDRAVQEGQRTWANEFAGLPGVVPAPVAQRPQTADTAAAPQKTSFLDKLKGKFNMSSNALLTAGQMLSSAAAVPGPRAPATKKGGGTRKYPGPYLQGLTNIAARAPSGLMNLKTRISDPTIDSSVARNTKKLEELLYG